MKHENLEKFYFYPTTPTQPHEIEYTIFMAEQFIFKKLYKVSGKDNNHPLVSSYFSKEYLARSLGFKEEFPDYLGYNKRLWRYVERKEGEDELLEGIVEWNKSFAELWEETREFTPL